jgi:segregation and condensation protein A
MSTLPASEAPDQRAAARIDLGQFHGPLDLLLHLVRTGELDITGLPVVEVVRQCDEYLRLIESIDLEAAGDHLVMAATLVHMKSRRLLPPDPLAETEVEAAMDVVPGRLAGAIEELRRAAEQLQEREAAMELVFRRPSDRIKEFAGEQGIEADLYALVNAFQAILKRIGSEPLAGRITREKVSLMERVAWLIDLLNERRRVPFRSLFEGQEDRLSCILIFLALLEVLRLRVARAFQSHHQEDILVILAEELPPVEAEETRVDA